MSPYKSNRVIIPQKLKLIKNANSEISAALYMASLSASGYNKACAELYQRLIEKEKLENRL